MANYYQTVPGEEQNQMTGGEDDGCSWLLDNTLSQSAMPDQVDESLLIWNDMGKNKKLLNQHICSR